MEDHSRSTPEAFTGIWQRSFEGNSFKLNGFGTTETTLYTISLSDMDNYK